MRARSTRTKARSKPPKPMPETDPIPIEAQSSEAAEIVDIPETVKEEVTPVIEVHEPHEGVHSWKDALIHIAIIVVGLLIALGLDETAEYIHHRHEARHARELLVEEMAANGLMVQSARYTLAMHEDYLFNDLAVLARFRRHALTAHDRIVLYHPPGQLADSAWQAAQQSGATDYFSYEEIHQYWRLYTFQSQFNSTMNDNMIALQNAQTMFYLSAADRFDQAKSAPSEEFYGRRGDAAAHAAYEKESPHADKLQSLTAAQLDRLVQTIQEGIYQDEKLINRCDWLAEDYKEMGH